MSVDQVLLLLVLLFFKHYVFDFTRLQCPYMYLNKGTYGHPGGIFHTGLHVAASFVVLTAFLWWTQLALPLWAFLVIYMGEALIHYHMDFYKMSKNAREGWLCNKHPQFWDLTGKDQLVHSLTYLGMAWVAEKSIS